MLEVVDVYNEAAVGAKIQQERIKRGLRSKDMAEMLFMDPSVYSRLESNGTADGHKIVMVARVLGIEAVELFEAGLV